MYFLGLDAQDLQQNKIHTWSFELQMMLQPHLGKKKVQFLSCVPETFFW